MNVIRLEHEMSTFTNGETCGIRYLVYRWQRTVDALGVTLKYVGVGYFLKLFVRVVISDK